MSYYFFTRIMLPNDKTKKWSTTQVMFWVIIALIPAIIVQTQFFGYGNLIQIVLGVLLALLFEGTFLVLRKKSLTPLLDGSAILTAILLAISIPSLAPWWIIAIGLFFAIVVTKQLYGGLGHNIFNPAMVGYVVLLISFPVQMTGWINPLVNPIEQLSFLDSLNVILNIKPLSAFAIEGITQATPLDLFKQAYNQGMDSLSIIDKYFYTLSEFAGIGWQKMNIAFLIGGIVLILLRVIRWQIPVIFLLTLFIISGTSYMLFPDSNASPWFHLLSGSTMLGAFFILTDPVSASTTAKGQIIYAILIGLLVWLIRSFGNYPDAVAFAVLFANLCVPLIDYLTKPKAYGH